jgi:hypothetical protein
MRDGLMGKPRLTGASARDCVASGLPPVLFALLVHEYKIVDIGPLGLGALERAQAWIEEAQ